MTDGSESVVGRLAIVTATLGALLIIDFLLPRALPGDPISALVSQDSASYVSDPGTRALLLEQYGLDDPLLVQLRDHVAALVRGDLGHSTQHHVPVTDLLRARLPRSGLLLATSFVLGSGAGIVVGLRAGWRRHTATDAALVAAAAALRSVPVFLLGAVAVAVFSVKLGWFPISGSRPPFTTSGATVGQVVHHLALPALVLAAPFFSAQMLVMRSGTAAQLHTPYLRAARAAGIRPSRLRRHYAGRNALLPVVELMVVQLSAATTGLILVETVFRYDGIGLMLTDAVRARDYPTLQGGALVLGALVVVAAQLADLLQRAIDPRVSTP